MHFPLIDRRGRAFGGAKLAGTNIVRNAFLDEAGTSHPEHEPFLVMAGVVINADTQWLEVEEYLWSLLEEEYDPVPENAFFHAHALYMGRTPFDERNGWDQKRRFEMLETLANIPKLFQLPVVFACFERKNAQDIPEVEGMTDPNTRALALTAAMCMMKVERLMQVAQLDEVAKVTIEDSPQLRNQLRDMTRLLRNWPQELIDDEFAAQCLPLRKVVGTPQFEMKQDASLLQIADTCAYVIKRQMMRDSKIEQFFKPIRDCLAFFPKDPEHPLFRPST